MKRGILVAWQKVAWQKHYRILTLWLGVLIATLVASPVNAEPVNSDADSAPTLLVMGDSLSAAYNIEREESWVALLEERLPEEATVVNASISGETTSGGVQRFGDLLRQHEPDIVLLELGGNDGLRGLPPRQMQANLATMIEASQAADAEVLLLGIDIPPNYGAAYREAFTTVYYRLAEEYDIELVPFLLEGVATDDALMQDDGIHPTAAAQPVILETVWEKLEGIMTQ
ncbi:acyl-CoA thioesterase-1 [Vreelandella subterranea]|uniref:Acyl-CoA thioesterase-1 n=1 Tax=Vreelandella subterranea TaxID=416874 RepID=A0A1H9WM02_9GAMM|nr:arylesterase [Halomonas subterranea]SES34942.1 acyl-CoA thioesterase-1 [Halomonas subterranea]